MVTEDWKDQARCKSLPYKDADRLFFLRRGGSPNAAKAFCNKCPVNRECLYEAILYDELGIWAGTTEDTRKFISPALKPILQEQARQNRSLKEFGHPNAPQQASANSSQCPYCLGTESGTCHCTTQQPSNLWQTDSDIPDSEPPEIYQEPQSIESDYQLPA